MNCVLSWSVFGLAGYSEGVQWLRLVVKSYFRQPGAASSAPTSVSSTKAFRLLSVYCSSSLGLRIKDVHKDEGNEMQILRVNGLLRIHVVARQRT